MSVPANSQGLSSPVLVLNRNFQPVRITTARQAFSMLFVGKACAVDERYQCLGFAEWCSATIIEVHEWIGTPKGPVRVPRVLVLPHCQRTTMPRVRLSRKNIFARDGFRCQYCGKEPPARDLNLDHVIPRSRGGLSTWENLVTSCRICNLEKGHALPQECGMVLLKKPICPPWVVSAQMLAAQKRLVEWDPFLPPVRDRIEAA